MDNFFKEFLVCCGIGAGLMVCFLLWCVLVVPKKNRRRMEKEKQDRK